MVDGYIIEMVKSAKRSGLDDNKARERLLALVKAGQADGATPAQQRRSRAARENLIYSVVPFVYKVCVKYSFSHDLTDSFSFAMEVVTQKVDGWDPELGTLTTYLWPHVRGAVLREQNKDAHGEMSKSEVAAWLAIRDAIYSGEKDIASATGLSERRVAEILATAQIAHTASLDTFVEDGSGISRIDTVAAQDVDAPFADEEEHETTLLIKAAIRRVVKTHRDVIVFQVLLGLMSGRDAAAELGVSVPRISQLSSALKKRLQDELPGVIY